MTGILGQMNSETLKQRQETKSTHIHLQSSVVPQSPCILGGCEHIFCHVCVEKYLGKSCPVCHIPANVKDADVNRQLFNIASLCRKLRDVLSSPEDEDLQTAPGGEIYNEADESTPRQPVKDIYHFDTPSVVETDQQKRSKQDSSELDNGEGKSMKNSDGGNFCKNNSGRNRNAGQATNEAGERYNSVTKKSTRRKSGTARNKSSGQSTVTQGFEDDGTTEVAAEYVTRTSHDLTEHNLVMSNEISEFETIFKKRSDNLKNSNHNLKVRKARRSESIAEMSKTTTRMRHRSEPLNGNLPVESEAERTSCFKDVLDSDRLSADLNKSKKSLEEDALAEAPSHTEKVEYRPSLSENTGPSPASKTSKGKLRSTKNKKSTSTLKMHEESSVIPESSNSESSRSPSLNIKKNKRNAKCMKSKVFKADEIPKEPSETPSREACLSTPKLPSKGKSRLKSVTPVSPKRQILLQQKSTVETISSQKTALSPLGTNTTGVTRTMTPRSTPLRSKDNGSPAALSPALNKRNAKGETPLQVAAIKNDEKKVAELLRAGANPNVRDNAGWSPLHEACNRGYTEVARLLLDSGAMLNVPGMDNDTPLHDAVSNNRLDCVKLLVSRGASVTARNLQGLTPEDLAVSVVMKEALKTSITNDVPSTSQLPLDTLEYQQPCLMGTSLSREQKVVLQKCAGLLSAKQCDECTPEVTHVVTSCNDKGLCARTIKYLQAVLTGKWIVSMDWVKTCLELGCKVCEEGFEVQGTSTNPNSQAPMKGRMNRKQQLPGLFDGCQFYFHGNFEYSMPSKDDLLDVIRSGGGKILSREPKPGHLGSLELTVPYHANPEGTLANCAVFIIHENSAEFQPIRTKHMRSVPVSWILECAAEFKLQDIN